MLSKVVSYMHSNAREEHWLLKVGDLEMGDHIGSGAFGVVHRGMLHQHTPVAIKVLEVPDELYSIRLKQPDHKV